MIHAGIADYGPAQTSAAIAMHRRPARLGAMVAAAICAVIAASGWVIEPDGGLTVGLLGLPSATFLMRPSVPSSDRP